MVRESRVAADTWDVFLSRFSCILNVKERKNYCINNVPQNGSKVKYKLLKKF